MFENLTIKLNEIGYYYGEKNRQAELRRSGTEYHPWRLYREW